MNEIQANETMSDIQEKLKDKDFQRKLLSDPHQYGKELGYDTDNIELKVVQNTKSVMYLPIHEEIESFDLSSVQAAGANSASTVATAASVGCVCSTTSTASSAGSAATVA